MASCTVPWRSTRDVTDGDNTFVKLKDGTRIPIANAASGRAPEFLVDGMPVVEGELEGRGATKYRDSGCNTVIVKSFVPNEKLTSITSPVFLLGRMVKYLPEAESLCKNALVHRDFVFL